MPIPGLAIPGLVTLLEGWGLSHGAATAGAIALETAAVEGALNSFEKINPQMNPRDINAEDLMASEEFQIIKNSMLYGQDYGVTDAQLAAMGKKPPRLKNFENLSEDQIKKALVSHAARYGTMSDFWDVDRWYNWRGPTLQETTGGVEPKNFSETTGLPNMDLSRTGTLPGSHEFVQSDADALSQSAPGLAVQLAGLSDKLGSPQYKAYQTAQRIFGTDEKGQTLTRQLFGNVEGLEPTYQQGPAGVPGGNTSDYFKLKMPEFNVAPNISEEAVGRLAPQKEEVRKLIKSYFEGKESFGSSGIPGHIGLGALPSDELMQVFKTAIDRGEITNENVAEFLRESERAGFKDYQAPVAPAAAPTPNKPMGLGSPVAKAPAAPAVDTRATTPAAPATTQAQPAATVADAVRIAAGGPEPLRPSEQVAQAPLSQAAYESSLKNQISPIAAQQREYINARTPGMAGPIQVTQATHDALARMNRQQAAAAARTPQQAFDDYIEEQRKMGALDVRYTNPRDEANYARQFGDTLAARERLGRTLGSEELGGDPNFTLKESYEAAYGPMASSGPDARLPKRGEEALHPQASTRLYDMLRGRGYGGTLPVAGANMSSSSLYNPAEIARERIMTNARRYSELHNAEIVPMQDELDKRRQLTHRGDVVAGRSRPMVLLPPRSTTRPSPTRL